METCAFCERNIDKIYKMIKSPSRPRIYICDQCIDIASALVHDNINKKSTANMRKKMAEIGGLEMVAQKKKQRYYI